MIMGIINHLKKWVKSVRVYNDTFRDLSIMSCRELNDLGIHKSDIYFHAQRAYQESMKNA